MTEFKNQLAAFGVTLLTALIGYVVMWVVNKLRSGKLDKLMPINNLLDEQLPKYFKPVLQNVYQKYIKPIYKSDAWTPEKQEEAFNHAFEDLIKILPDFLVKMANIVKKDWKEMLKAKLQQYLELNKFEINTSTITGSTEPVTQEAKPAVE